MRGGGSEAGTNLALIRLDYGSQLPLAKQRASNMKCPTLSSNSPTVNGNPAVWKPPCSGRFCTEPAHGPGELGRCLHPSSSWET